MSGNHLGDKVAGVAKEAVGKATGDTSTEREGEAQQKKAQKATEADRLQDEAERKRVEEAEHEDEEREHRS